MKDRTNFRNFKELEAGCDKARVILHRRHPTMEEMQEALQLALKAIRTLRSWLSSRNEELRDLRGPHRPSYIKR